MNVLEDIASFYITPDTAYSIAQAMRRLAGDALEKQPMTADKALDLLKAEILKFGSQRKWSKEHLISNQYVSDILTGKVGIGKSVQAALGIKRVIMYEKVENGNEQ